jgi:GTP-binding protein
MSVKRQWDQMMELYLTGRAPLRALLLLMDIRRTPGEWEKTLVALGSHCGWGIIPIVTKADKLSLSQRKPALRKIASGIGLDPKQLVPCSSLKREGLGDVWRALSRFVEEPYVAPEIAGDREIDEGEASHSIDSGAPEDLT